MNIIATTRRAAIPTFRPSRRRDPRGRLRWHAARRAQTAPYLFLIPFLVVFAAFIIAPLGYALYLSLFRTQLIGGQVFVGIANYASAIRDGVFYAGVGRVALFFVIQVPIMLVLALIFALIIDSGTLRLRRVFRLGFFVPYAVPSVVGALIWGYLYGRQFGPIDQLTAAIGLHNPDLLSASAMLPALANIVSWQYTGYNMIILFAALQAIPAELRDAAAVDGAGPVRFALRVKIPLVRPAIVLTTIFSIIGSLQLFTEPQIMSSLAPSVIGSSYTPNLYAYNLSFTNQQYEYSAAISFFLGIVTFAGSYVFMWWTNRRVRSSS